jgi:hypothetical protein
MRIHHAMHQTALTQLNQAADYQARNVKDTILGSQHLELEDGGGEVQPTKSREDGFQPPKEKEDVRTKPDQMMNEALNQVPDAVHFNPKSKRTMVTIYAGNLDFKANGKDVLESLRKRVRHRIQVNEIAVPNYHGRSKGYVFITLSWVREADLAPADICKFYSGVIQLEVNPEWYSTRTGWRLLPPHWEPTPSGPLDS